MVAPGHGETGTKADVRAHRAYLLDLMAAIRAARAQGLADNSEAMVAAIRAERAPRHGTWDQFGPWLPENIEGLTRLGFSRKPGTSPPSPPILGGAGRRSFQPDLV